MVKFIVNFENELESKLLFLNLEHDKPLKRAEASILEITNVLKKLNPLYYEADLPLKVKK